MHVYSAHAVADRHSFNDQHLHAIIEVFLSFLVSYVFVIVVVVVGVVIVSVHIPSWLFVHQCVEFSLSFSLILCIQKIAIKIIFYYEYVAREGIKGMCNSFTISHPSLMQYII